MRIHLPLHPSQFKQPTTSPSDSPLVQLGGDLVLVELQGELSWEGEKAGGVVGVIGLDRPEKPTLHLGPHHLLHGKFAKLQKPYAVIRRVVGNPSASSSILSSDKDKGIAVQGAADEEDSSDEEEEEDDEEDEDEDEGPLFPPIKDGTPTKETAHPQSSSPYLPPSTPRDYSSDIEMSSPMAPSSSKRPYSDDEEDEAEAEERKKRKKLADARKAKREERKRKRGEGTERTRHYAVVGIVRKKVVFSLRPEPLVAPTILPE
ncbi:hypothetical protein IAR50_001638 [Cryptococcus sp. DSM 104548]